MKIEYEQTTPTAIVRVLNNGTKCYVQIEYRHEVYPDNRTTYPMHFEDVGLFFDCPERVTVEIREAVYNAFAWIYPKGVNFVEFGTGGLERRIRLIQHIRGK